MYNFTKTFVDHDKQKSFLFLINYRRKRFLNFYRKFFESKELIDQRDDVILTLGKLIRILSLDDVDN